MENLSDHPSAAWPKSIGESLLHHYGSFLLDQKTVSWLPVDREAAGSKLHGYWEGDLQLRFRGGSTHGDLIDALAMLDPPKTWSLFFQGIRAQEAWHAKCLDNFCIGVEQANDSECTADCSHC